MTCALEGPPAGERPTRIAFLTHEFTMGGIERVHLNLAAAFLRKGLEVDIVMLKKRGEFLSQIPAAVRVVELPSAGSWRRLRDNISDYLLHRRPTVLVASTEHLCVFALWARAGINSDSRIVVNVQTQSAPEQARRERWKHRWFIPLFMRRYYRQAHAIIAVSEGVAEETARIAWLPRERVQVIYNPSVTDELFDRARQPPAHPWLTDDGPPVVLAAGRLVDQKDFPTLLRAFAVLRRRRDARLLILGEGPRRAALEALVRQLGIADEVAMPGFVDNPYACMARARLFVLSSAWEGLPLVLGEALACGCPVVSTDCPSGPREVLDRGSYGRLFAAALVAGTRHVAYVASLGIPPSRTFVGYDAVDNDHFHQGAAAARGDRDHVRVRLGAPARFFLASARFVEKKNIFRLLEAYAIYHARAGGDAWNLVLLGDGDLRPRLEAHRSSLGLEAGVLMPGFKQYDELPAWYGLASAFVHASTVEQWGLVVNEAMAAGLPVLVSERCGCAPDLVEEGVNGFTFDPFDVELLAVLMHRVAHGGVDCAAMGRASQVIIADWGTERFADSLAGAVDIALRTPVPKVSWLDRLLLRALLYR